MDFLSTLTLAAESADKIQETVNATMFNVGDGNGIWYLIGAALVFFMQCGFAMVETGFTRAKNAGNIIMKNLMDFCLGTIAFVLLGFGLMLGEDTFFGLIGVPNLDVLTQLSDFNRCAEFVFNLVFCATAATIVSGAMAERTKFISYCIYSFVISLVVYPSRSWFMLLSICRMVLSIWRSTWPLPSLTALPSSASALRVFHFSTSSKSSLKSSGSSPQRC